MCTARRSTGLSGQYMLGRQNEKKDFISCYCNYDCCFTYRLWRRFKKSKETDVDKSSDSTFSKTEENTLEEDTTKEVNNDISDITEEKLRSHPETDASFFETTPSRQSLHGVEGEIAITGYEGPDSIVVIPEEIDGKKVVAIEYLGTENITSLLIPGSVIRVCEDAFMSSYNLKLVVFE